MLTTCEMRWFFPGSIPESIETWFQENITNSQQQPEERTDVYLYSPNCDFMGIKLRQGRLEIKWRNAELGVLKLGEFVSGKAEKWGKWLCNDKNGETFQPAQVVANPIWVSVKKVRYSQFFQVTPESKPQLLASDAHEGAAKGDRNGSSDNGCSVEITHLTVQQNTWWSLGFEATGEESKLMENLQITASSVFDTYDGFKLLAENSFAYPHWLEIIYV